MPISDNADANKFIQNEANLSKASSIKADKICHEQIDITDVEIKTKPKSIDTLALNGLRGFISVYIMTHHSFKFSRCEQDLLGSVWMPMFFLISGFVFGIVEGNKKYHLIKCCTELKSYPSDDESQSEFIHYDAKSFYRRRIARILPLFYLCNIISIPLQYGNYGWTEVGTWRSHVIYPLTIFAANTWSGISFQWEGSSWFVSTMVFFYWIFPSLLTRLQRYTIKQKQNSILIHYVLNIVIAIGALLVAGFYEGSLYGPGPFIFATFWPVSRLPVFIMGLLGGLLRIEVGMDGLTKCSQRKTRTMEQWQRRSNWLGLIICVLFIICGVIENCVLWFGAAFWLQIFIAWIFLEFIWSLTCESNKHSIWYLLLTNKFALWLGKISYALYLFHQLIIWYIMWLVYGKFRQRPDCDGETDCDKQWELWNWERTIPMWCIPIVCVMAFPLAVLLNKFVEEPMRKWLRPKKN